MIEIVRPSDRFERDIKELSKEYPRISEIRRALIWELARNPTAGESVFSHPEYWVFLTYPIGSMPVFKVLYKFSKMNPKVVILLRIAPSTKDLETEI